MEEMMSGIYQSPSGPSGSSAAGLATGHQGEEMSPLGGWEIDTMIGHVTLFRLMQA